MHITCDKGVNAAALTEGLRITSKLLKDWGMGCVELYQCISAWAAVITMEEHCLASALKESEYGWPGVFAYEVTEELGAQLRRKIKNGDLPSEQEVLERTRIQIARFCDSCDVTERDKIVSAYLEESRLYQKNKLAS